MGNALVHSKHLEVRLFGFKGKSVYAGIFTISTDDYEDFRDALSKLT